MWLPFQAISKIISPLWKFTLLVKIEATGTRQGAALSEKGSRNHERAVKIDSIDVMMIGILWCNVIY